MKIIDAYWEIENIGLKTVEICIENPNEELKEEDYSGYDHVVVKLPGLAVNQVHKLEESGFNFIENQLEISRMAKEVKIDPLMERIACGYEMIQADNKGFELISQGIQEGMFTTDRICIDPKLGKQLAINRYLNWAKSMFKEKEDYRFFLIRKVDEGLSIGFISVRVGDPVNCEIPLVGIFEKYKALNVGFLLVYFPLKFAEKNGNICCKTKISLNNLGIVKLYLHFDYRINKAYTVLRKIITK